MRRGCWLLLGRRGDLWVLDVCEFWGMDDEGVFSEWGLGFGVGFFGT